MKNKLAISLLSLSILAAFASTSARAANSSQTSAGISQDILKLMQADNVAQLRLQKKLIDENDPQCGPQWQCDGKVKSLALSFSELKLSDGAWLEIFNTQDAEVLRYDASEIEAVTAGNNGKFVTPSIPGNTLTVRIHYPQGILPGADDKAIIARLMGRMDTVIAAPPVDDERQPVVCLKNGDEAQQRNWDRSHAVGYAYATGWMIGTGNYALTNFHVMGGEEGQRNGDPIPYRSLRFNYQSPDCADNGAAASRDQIVNIKAGTFIASGRGNIDKDDWTLFSLDPLEYREAAVKSIFGGLALAGKDLEVEQSLSAIGHGRTYEYILDARTGDPGQGTAKRISTTSFIGQPCRVLPLSEGEYKEGEFKTNCFLSGGNSGSPVLGDDGKVIGLYKGGNMFAGWGITVQYLRQALAKWHDEGQFGQEVTGSGHPRVAHLALPSFTQPGEMLFSEGRLSFAPVVAGRTFTHQSGFTRLMSVARNQRGEEVELQFRLAQDNACGLSNLASVCDKPGATRLKVWLDTAETASQVALGDSVIGWLPVAVKSHGQLLANQLMRYRFSHYQPQQSPFGSQLPVLRKTLDNHTQYLNVFRHDDFRSGMTAVRLGEGPLTESTAIPVADGTAYAGMTPLYVEVINQANGSRQVMRLRGGLTNSCTQVSAPQGNWTPMNSSVCEATKPGGEAFTDGSVYLLASDNSHLPAGHYKGLLPLMIRNWDNPQQTQPVEIAIDYQWQ